MDTLFPTLLTICITCLLLGIAGGFVWLIEHTTWKHVIITFSLISTIFMTGAGLYAYWKVFGWWCLALIALAIVHGSVVAWFTFNSEKPFLNRPIYKVGGGSVTPRLHR